MIKSRFIGHGSRPFYWPLFTWSKCKWRIAVCNHRHCCQNSRAVCSQNGRSFHADKHTHVTLLGRWCPNCELTPCWIMSYFHILCPMLPSVLWRCWLGDRKGIRPVKAEWWDAGMVICLGQGADLYMAQLMPLPLTISCSSKSRLVLTFSTGLPKSVFENTYFTFYSDFKKTWLFTFFWMTLSKSRKKSVAKV